MFWWLLQEIYIFIFLQKDDIFIDVLKHWALK